MLFSAPPVLHNAGFPVFAVTFVTKDRVVIAGGGGVGRHGVANGLRTLLIDNDAKLVEVESIDLPPGGDSPTSMAAVAYEVGPSGESTVMLSHMRDIAELGSNTEVALLVGMGEGLEGTDECNRHLRLFAASNLQPCGLPGSSNPNVAQYDLLKMGPEAVVGYQRAIAVSPRGNLVAVGSANTKNDAVCVAFLSDPSKTLWRATAPGGPRDLSFSADGSQLAVATDRTLTIYNSRTGKELYTPRDSTYPIHWTHAQFVSNSRLIAGSHDRVNGKAFLTVFDCDESMSEVYRKRLSGVKAISALTATPEHIAIGTPGGDIHTYTRRLVPLQHFRQFHRLAITAIAIDPEDNFVISTSFGGTVGALKITRKWQAIDRFWNSVPGTVFWTGAWALLVLVLATVLSFYLGPESLFEKVPQILEHAPGRAQGFINRHVNPKVAKHIAPRKLVEDTLGSEASFIEIQVSTLEAPAPVDTVVIATTDYVREIPDQDPDQLGKVKDDPEAEVTQ